MLKAAGFDSFPKDTAGFLAHAQGAARTRARPAAWRWATPPATASGRNWLIWSHGGKLVDKNNKVVIDSPETHQGAGVRQGALRHLHPGHAVLAGPEQQQGLPRRPGQRHQQRHLDLLRRQELAPTRRSRRWPRTSATRAYPIGPVGVPTESHLFFNQMVMKYTKYPQAAKEFLRFMMEKEQFDPWLTGAGGYIAPPLAEYAEQRDLDLGPEAHAVPRRGEEPCVRRATPASWATRRLARRPTSSSPTWWPRRPAARRRPKEAAERAQKRAERYYKV